MNDNTKELIKAMEELSACIPSYFLKVVREPFKKFLKFHKKFHQNIAVEKYKTKIKTYTNFIDRNLVLISQRIELTKANSETELELLNYIELELKSLRQMISNLNEIELTFKVLSETTDK